MELTGYYIVHTDSGFVIISKASKNTTIVMFDLLSSCVFSKMTRFEDIVTFYLKDCFTDFRVDFQNHPEGITCDVYRDSDEHCGYSNYFHWEIS